jgi:hypothetical protein
MARGPKDVPGNLIPSTAFTQLAWWGRLDAEEKKAVERESNELARARFHEGASKLEMGKHLIALRDLLEPHRVFVKHLKNFRMSFKTAYRYINAYKNAEKRFPPAVLSVLMARGWEILGESESKPYGKYTPVIQAHKQLTPPKTSDPVEIVDWAKKVEAGYKEYRSEIRTGTILPDERADPEVLLGRAVRSARSCFQKLPRNHKTRASWVNKLVGMMLNELGVSGEQSFSPIAISEDFRQQFLRPVGRPRTLEGDAA